MFHKCCVVSCDSRRSVVKLFQFPKFKIGHKKWLKFVSGGDQKSFSQLRKLYVCEKHFEKRFITPKSRLRFGAYPTLLTSDEIANGYPDTPDIDTELVPMDKTPVYHDHSYHLSSFNTMEVFRLENSNEGRVWKTIDNSKNMEVETEDNQLSLTSKSTDEVPDSNMVNDSHDDDEVINEPLINVPMEFEPEIKNKQMKNEDDRQQFIVVSAKVTVNPRKEENRPEDRPILHDLGFLKEKLSSVLHSQTFCALCLEPSKRLTSLQDNTFIVYDNWTQTVHLRDLYEYVFHQKAELSASGYICKDCSEQLKESYIFIKNYKLTTKLLESYINDLKLITDDDENMVDNFIPGDNLRFNVMLLKGQHVRKYLPNENKESNENKDITNDNHNVSHETFGCEDTGIPETANIINAKLIVIDRNKKTFKIRTAKNAKQLKISKKLKAKRNRTIRTENVNCEICSKTFPTQSDLLEHYTVKHIKVPCKFCNTLIDEKDFQQHLATEHKNKVNFCEICDRAFYDPESVILHNSIVHENYDSAECILCSADYGDHSKHLKVICKGCGDLSSCVHRKYLYSVMEQKLNHIHAKVKCPDCEFVTRVKMRLLSHANQHHLKIHPYICPHCGEQFYDQYSMRKHYTEYHKSVLYCKYCESPYDSAGALATHEGLCSETKREHACQYCAASFHTFKQLNKHHNTRHKETFPCQLCNKVYRSEYQKQLHTTRVHGGAKTKMYKKKVCRLCHDVFDLSHELWHHQKSHQGPDAKYNCKPCGTEFDCLQSLESHNKTSHSTTDRVVCTKCGLKVKQSALEQHLEEHKWDTKVNCDECGRSFTNIMRLKFHIRKQHAIKCKLCDHGTQTNQALDAHVNRIHKRIRPYVCHLCGKQFYGRVSLTYHTVFCSNKPHCPICGKGFATPYNLKKHLYTHTKKDSREFKCDVCGDKFRSADVRNSHILRTHHEECFPCTKCPKKFLSKTKLNLHIDDFHH